VVGAVMLGSIFLVLGNLLADLLLFAADPRIRVE
jgi:ABC-type dipeptide/oligopeptide/nickel transport system permease component